MNISIAYHRHVILATLIAPFLGGGLAAQDITSNLRSRWRLTETSGAAAADSGSLANNGAYTNGVLLANSTTVPVDGAVAANFDGVNDYVAIPNEAYYDITGTITVACWIKVDVWDISYQAIITKGDSAWRLQRSGTGSGVTFDCSGLSTVAVSSSIPVNDGKWHHVAGVFTGSQLRIYVDGALSNSVSVSGSIALNNYPVEIGRNAQLAGREFDGAIYDARIYNRALSAADISYLYLQGGPIGHWKLNHASGTAVSDASLYASHGAVFNGTAWTTRCNGTGAFDFNGLNHYVSVADASHLQPTSAVSIAGWIKADSWGVGTEVDVILRKGDGNPNNYQLAISDGRLEFLLDGNDGSGIRGNTVLSTGRWYHVAATWDGATVRLYVDGVLDASPMARSGSIGTDTRSLYLGGRTGGTDVFDGMVQQVILYNRALSGAEVANLAGLTGHWKFAEGTGSSAADSTLSVNHATLSGGAVWATDCGGKASLQTNGADGRAQTATAFTPPSDGTVAFWMQAAAGTTRRRIFGLGGDWEVRHEADGTLAFDLCSDAGTTFVTTQPLNEIGRWYHVAASYNCEDETYEVYVDGELRKAGTHIVDLVRQSAGVLSFGTRTGSTEYWAGGLRDFRIYSRRLCPSEIAELAGLAVRWKLDETSGTVAADASGWGRNGTIVGSPAWTAGKLNNALQLDGATYASAPGLLNNPKNVTIAAWVNLTSADSGGSEVISLGDCFAIRLNQGGTSSRAFFYDGATWSGPSVGQTFSGVGWRHFAAVFDDDSNLVKFYINGVEVASLTTAASIVYTGAGANVVVGRHGNGATTYDLTGKVDDVRVYTRALCPSQIEEIVKDGGGAYQGVRIISWVEVR